MNDRELGRLLEAAAPQVVQGSTLHAAGLDLLEEIMAAPDSWITEDPRAAADLAVDLPAVPASAPVGSRWGNGRRALAGLAAAAAVAAAVTVPTVYLRGGPEAAVEVAPAVTENGVPAPGLLLDDPAFTIGYVQGSVETQGEIQFADGERRFQVTWYPKDQYQGYLNDRLADDDNPRGLNVLGIEAKEFSYSSGDFAVMMPPQGKTFYEIRASVGDREAFESLVGRLKRVTQAGWNAAMPANVVTPDREKKVARELLKGVPLPPGFDVSELPTGQTNDRYQFSAHVLGQAACGWIAEYLKADEAGNADRMGAARAALKGSHNWIGLKAMVDEGDYAEGVWEYADSLVKGTQVKGGSDAVTVANSYKDALGCA